MPGLTVTLIAGPPCSGKSTYLLRHAGPEDLVVDYDALAAAVRPTGSTHGHPESHRHLVWEARDAILERLRLGSHGVRRAWIIAAAPRRKDRDRYRDRYGADVVIVMSPEDVCLRRALGERPEGFYQHVRAWFGAYEHDPRDTVVDGYEPEG